MVCNRLSVSSSQPQTLCLLTGHINLKAIFFFWGIFNEPIIPWSQIMIGCSLLSQPKGLVASNVKYKAAAQLWAHTQLYAVAVSKRNYNCDIVSPHNCNFGCKGIQHQLTTESTNANDRFQPGTTASTRANKLQLLLQLHTLAPQPQQLLLHVFQTTVSSLDWVGNFASWQALWILLNNFAST